MEKILPAQIKPLQFPLLPTAWGITLLISLLPDILFREVTGVIPSWLFWVKIGLLLALLFASLGWKPLRALRLYWAVLLAVYLLEWGVDAFFHQLRYEAWFATAAPFVKSVGLVQAPRTVIGILLVLVSLLLMGHPGRFFFVKGKLDAVAAPIPLIWTCPPKWNRLGPILAGALPLGLLAFIFIFGSLPSLQSMRVVLPLLPFVLLFAATNAFGEEMAYRAPWLGALEGPVGAGHALLITAVYFGIGHFYGVPYGITGVLMSFILGWLLGKSMLETRGFFWAWFIHFCMDVVIFFFMALGSVTPGG